MNTLRLLAVSTLAAAALVSVAAQAEPITYFTDTVTSSDSTEMGRASRSGTPLASSSPAKGYATARTPA